MHDRNSYIFIFFQYNEARICFGLKSYQIELYICVRHRQSSLKYIPMNLLHAIHIQNDIPNNMLNAHLLLCSSDKSEKYEHHFYQNVCRVCSLYSILVLGCVHSTVWRVGIYEKDSENTHRVKCVDDNFKLKYIISYLLRLKTRLQERKASNGFSLPQPFYFILFDTVLLEVSGRR